MKQFLLFTATLLLFFSQTFAYPPSPDPRWTPGSVCTKNDPDYEEKRYPEKIAYCRRNVSKSLKTELYELYGIPDKSRSNYTIDHLIPLSIGGDNSPENLWPEHKEIKAGRPHFEEEIYAAVSSGELSQKEAIKIILKEKFKRY